MAQKSKSPLLAGREIIKCLSTMMYPLFGSLNKQYKRFQTPMSHDYWMVLELMQLPGFDVKSLRLFSLWLLIYPYTKYSCFWESGSPKFYRPWLIVDFDELYAVIKEYWQLYHEEYEYLDYVPATLVKSWELGKMSYRDSFHKVSQLTLKLRRL